jgi:WD40 repeat protein
MLVREVDGNTLVELNLSAQVSAFDLSADGKFLTVATYSADTATADIHVYDAYSGELLFTISEAHKGSIPFLRYTPDGNTLISASSDMFMKFWSHTDGTLIKSVQVQRDSITCMAMSPDGLFIVTGSFNTDSEINVWNNTGIKLTTVTKSHTHCYLAAFSPDNRYLLFHSSSNMSLYRTSNWQREWLLPFSSNISPWIGFTPSGNIYMADRKGTIKVINPINQELITTQEIGQTVGFSFSQDGKWIAVVRPNGYVEIVQSKLLP